MPARDGSIDLLRSYVNLTEPDFRLVVAWLTAAPRPVGPYPILVLNGELSSGKSTLARILRLLIDPHTCPVLALPSSTENLTDLPRMADYAEWGEATSGGLGWVLTRSSQPTRTTARRRHRYCSKIRRWRLS